jgi:iron complex outermembrane recepter protein
MARGWIPRRGMAGFAAILLSGAGAVAADADDAPGDLQTIAVTATRIAQPTFDVAASVNVVPINHDALGVNISESLRDVPGLLARDRQNYAQDEQISIRGFGARAPFGIRGVRIYIDGIPQSQPDGQGEVSEFDLAGADRVEVLRGPFSALYGNSSGGVIELFTADASGPPELDAGAVYGSFDTWRGSADVRGSSGGLSYNVGASQFETAGSRGHSSAERTTAQENATWHFNGGATLTVLTNYFDSPAQDPLGLTLAQFNADPQGTAPTAALYNTRKDATQGQSGAVYQLPIDSTDTFRMMVYGGERSVLQFLAIPTAAQLAPTSSGGVVDLDEAFGGLEPRWTHEMQLAGGPLNLIAGMTYDLLDERRRGYDNFVGSQLGVIGPLQRDESDDEHDLDEYLQAQWELGPWSMTAGVRHSEVDFTTVDYYVRPDSVSGNGTKDYDSTTPVAGVLYHATENLVAYASYGNGFETPTFTELAYQKNGAAGLNTALSAAHSRNAEVGAKSRWSTHAQATLAVFHTDTTNELAVASNLGGRSTYTNIPLSRRQGVELSGDVQLVRTLQLQLAYTYLDASVRTPYETCVTIGCAIGALVPVGARIPGVARDHFYTALEWDPGANWRAVLDDEYVGGVYANDLNSRSAYAGGYDLLDLAIHREWPWRSQTLRVFVRASNLLNRRYSGSVIVDNSSQEYFEAGPGRAAMLGVTLIVH